MRLSGTTPIRHNFGFKDCQVWLKEKLLEQSFEEEFNVISSKIAVRHEEEVYLDESFLKSI